MTRDEAIKIFNENTNIHDQVDTPRWIDRLAALGILKLDEPKDDGFHKLMAVLGRNPQGTFAWEIMNALSRAGLKLVEK